MCLAQRPQCSNAVRLKPAAPRSRVKHSTTEPLRSLFCEKLYFNTNTLLNSLPVSGVICRLLIAFANSFDPDQDGLQVRPDLNPTRLAL